MENEDHNNGGSLEQHKASTKRRILDSARNEFALHGKAGARIDRIARQADVNKAMIYYHFDSKDNLYLEVVRDLFSELTIYAERDITGEEPLADLLGMLVEIHTRLFNEVSELKAIVYREMANPNPEVLSRIAQVFGETGIPGMLAHRISEGVKSGEYRPVDPRQALVAFVTLSIGYHIMSPLVNQVLKIEDKEKFLEERKRVVVELFLNGLKAR
jgi:AcrR family transcriptional regulator